MRHLVPKIESFCEGSRSQNGKTFRSWFHYRPIQTTILPNAKLVIFVESTKRLREMQQRVSPPRRQGWRRPSKKRLSGAS
ncbi:MAG: hypothetical protein IKX28_01330, partial [Bacteroidales bacterium]|nr:hypothetical protein [Bacteroidales bacterium]